MSSLLSCCSFLCSGIKPQCISVVQFQKIWFRVDFLILKSFLFYYFHVVVKNAVTCSERFSGSICLLSLVWAFSSFISIALLLLSFDCNPSSSSCAWGPPWELFQVYVESSAPSLSDLSKTWGFFFFFLDSHWYHPHFVVGVVVLVLQDLGKYCLVWLQTLSTGFWFYSSVSLSALLCECSVS